MSPRKPKPTSSVSTSPVLRPEEVPVTQAMLYGVRDELIHRMGLMEGRLEPKFDGRFQKIDERFEKIDQRFEKIDERFEQVDKRFDRMEVAQDKLASEVSRVYTAMGLLRTELSAEISRVGVLVEEQNARNQVVLEGLSGLFRRQEKVESEVSETKRFIQEMTIALRKSGLPISS